MSKSAQIRAILTQNPKMDANTIAKKVGASPTTVYGVKSKMLKTSKIPAKTAKKWGKAVKAALIPAQNSSIPMAINKKNIQIDGVDFSFEQFSVIAKLMK